MHTAMRALQHGTGAHSLRAHRKEISLRMVSSSFRSPRKAMAFPGRENKDSRGMDVR